MLNVFEIAEIETRPGADRPWFRVAPAELYPTVLRHVADVVANGTRPPEPLGVLFDRANELPYNAFTELATLPFGDKIKNDEALRWTRAQALEIGRLWFTEILQTAVGGAIGLHILKDEDWRL